MGIRLGLVKQMRGTCRSTIKVCSVCSVCVCVCVMWFHAFSMITRVNLCFISDFQKVWTLTSSESRSVFFQFSGNKSYLRHFLSLIPLYISLWILLHQNCGRALEFMFLKRTPGVSCHQSCLEFTDVHNVCLILNWYEEQEVDKWKIIT